MAEVKSMGVIGGGQMGSGIAQLGIVSGLTVSLYDTDPDALTRASKSISVSLQRFVSKGNLSQAKATDALTRLKCTSTLQDLSSSDVVVEAIVESEDVKKKLFSQLDKITKGSCILASNTSSISITRLGAATRRAKQVIGMHFMNPPPIMKLVEIVRGADTSDDTFLTIKVLAERFEKTIISSQDYPGFIVNRILMPMINEAFFTLYTGVATKEDIDMGMKLGTNHPMGPLELADFIGLDICLSIMKILHAGLGDKYQPCPLLVQYVDAGRLGRKRGMGVYTYVDTHPIVDKEPLDDGFGEGRSFRGLGEVDRVQDEPVLVVETEDVAPVESDTLLSQKPNEVLVDQNKNTRNNEFINPEPSGWDCTAFFTTGEVFSSRDELTMWCKSIGRAAGVVIAIKKAENKKVGRRERISYWCERSGLFRESKKVKVTERPKKHTGTKKCGCPFLLKGVRLSDVEWKLEVVCGMHNHPLLEDKPSEGHSYVGSLTPSEEKLVVELSLRGVKPKEILRMLKDKDPTNASTIANIYNFKARYRINGMQI